eukprot:87758_1
MDIGKQQCHSWNYDKTPQNPRKWIGSQIVLMIMIDMFFWIDWIVDYSFEMYQTISMLYQFDQSSRSLVHISYQTHRLLYFWPRTYPPKMHAPPQYIRECHRHDVHSFDRILARTQHLYQTHLMQDLRAVYSKDLDKQQHWRVFDAVPNRSPRHRCVFLQCAPMLSHQSRFAMDTFVSLYYIEHIWNEIEHECDIL